MNESHRQGGEVISHLEMEKHIVGFSIYMRFVNRQKNIE